METSKSVFPARRVYDCEKLCAHVLMGFREKVCARRVQVMRSSFLCVDLYTRVCLSRYTGFLLKWTFFPKQVTNIPEIRLFFPRCLAEY